MEVQFFYDNADHLRLPIHIENDNDYLKTVQERYEAIINAFPFTDDERSILKEYTNRILNSIKAYYTNDTIGSYEIIYKLLKELSEDTNSILCFSAFKDCLIPKNSNGQAQLFRAREGTSYIEYPASEMGYVPFSQRSKCAANRYSLAGIPCLYLGNTSYVCWLEMNRPSDDKFCVSPYWIDDELSFFNIAIPIVALYEEAQTDNRDRLFFLFKIYLLEIATSVHIKQGGRQFQSEYIISQNIMRACIKLGLNGIIFYTTRASDNAMSWVCGINIALFIDYSEDNYKSSIFDNKTKHGDGVNYAMFKNLLPCQNYTKYSLAVDETSFIANIGSIKYQIKYSETQFHEFDNYIFVRWKSTESPTD